MALLNPQKTILNPLNNSVDRFINSLQNRLSSCVWLDTIYPIARVFLQNISGELGYLPMIWDGRSDYELLLHNDNLKAYCFFLEKDPATSNARNPLILTYNFSLIALFNMHVIKSTAVWKGHCENDLRNELMISLCGDRTVHVGTSYTEIRNVLSEIDSKFLNKTFPIYPFGGIRIDFTKDIMVDCSPVIPSMAC